MEVVHDQDLLFTGGRDGSIFRTSLNDAERIELDGTEETPYS